MTGNGITVLVGTTKGAFLVSGGKDRENWGVKGPFCDGWPINHVIGDPGSGTIWAGGGGEWHGAGGGVRRTAAKAGKPRGLPRVRWMTGRPTIPTSRR